MYVHTNVSVNLQFWTAKELPGDYCDVDRRPRELV